MRGPCHLTSAGQPGSRSSLFCTGTSYLRDMARAPALLGQTLPSHEDLLCSAWALPLDMTYQGTRHPEGAFLLSMRGCESRTLGPQRPKLQGRSRTCVCVCV